MSNEEQEEPGWMQIVLFLFTFNLIFPFFPIFSGMGNDFARGSNMVIWMIALFLSVLLVKIICVNWGPNI